MTDSSSQRRLAPSPAIAGTVEYRVPKHGAPTDLKLDANEGNEPSPDLLRRILEIGPDVMRRYPDAGPLQRALATKFAVAPEQVIVTAGADDALDRICRAMLGPGRRLLLTNPSFEMLPRYARIMGAAVDEVPWWNGSFPVGEFVARITPETSVVAVVSPNNPTGTVTGQATLRAISDAAPNALLLLDHAYVEFADEDLTAFALSLPNTVVVRTLSKAWSCAGLRTGFAIGPAEIIGWLRAAGGPYAVSRPSVALALARMEADAGETDAFIAQVRADRDQIHALLDQLGEAHTTSQGNFVLALSPRALWMRDALAGLGIAIRAYPGHAELGNALRITCPGDAAQCERVCRALRAALAPEHIILPAGQKTEPHLPKHGNPADFVKVHHGVAEKAHGKPAWQVCASTADVSEARKNAFVPIGLAGKATAEELTAAGAARVVQDISELEGFLR